MISKRYSTSRDLYSGGVMLIGSGGASALFSPLNMTTNPAKPYNAPADAVAVIWADRLFVSNLGSNLIVVRPVIPGSPEAPEYSSALYPGARGSYGPSSDWLFLSPSALAAAPANNDAGIAIPVGAIAFPLEVLCCGLVISGTDGDTLAFAAYGTNKRA